MLFPPRRGSHLLVWSTHGLRPFDELRASFGLHSFAAFTARTSAPVSPETAYPRCFRAYLSNSNPHSSGDILTLPISPGLRRPKLCHGDAKISGGKRNWKKKCQPKSATSKS